MNNVNLRAIALVAVLAAIIAAGIVLLRPPQPVFAKLEIRANEEGVSVAIPNCDMSGLGERFFMHIYPASAQDGVSAEYVGRDFDLSKEPATHSTTTSGSQCIVNRAFGVPHVKKVVIGQFTMPAGQCCKITWSRTFAVNN
jgi:hypothetical protein